MDEEKKPSAGAALADRWLSKKLGITGGAIGVISSLGISGDRAGLYVVIIAVVFLLAQGAVDVMKARKSGVPLTAALLHELRETLGELKGAGNPPA